MVGVSFSIDKASGSFSYFVYPGRKNIKLNGGKDDAKRVWFSL